MGDTTTTNPGAGAPGSGEGAPAAGSTAPHPSPATGGPHDPAGAAWQLVGRADALLEHLQSILPRHAAQTDAELARLNLRVEQWRLAADEALGRSSTAAGGSTPR